MVRKIINKAISAVTTTLLAFTTLASAIPVTTYAAAAKDSIQKSKHHVTSTKDTATKDTVTKSATGGNGAVQTGNPMTAVSVALVMLVASGAMFVCYRRKIEK